LIYLLPAHTGIATSKQIAGETALGVNAMGKGKGGEGLVLVGLGLLVLAGLVYYSETGQGENDSALIPNSLEGRIDFVVAALNRRFGKQWINMGFEVLKSYLEKTQPSLAALVSAVVQVEQMSKSGPMNSYAKQQTAIQMARKIRA
jgi:hypothetical protein